MEINNNEKTEYKLVQWNILSQIEFFCSPEAFPKADPQCLKWENRKKVLKEKIENLNADIFCFQEVDEFGVYVFELIDLDKYETTYFQKTGSTQGISIIYNKNKFIPLSMDKVLMWKDDLGNLSTQIFCYLFLQEKKENGKTLCVITTHFKAKAEFENIRLSQMKFLLNYINTDKSFLDQVEKFNCQDLIFCGDLNAEPEYSCIKYLEEYQIKNEPKFALKSAYNYSDPTKDDFIEMTTYKIRNDIEYYRVIDYIFYSVSNIEVISTTPTFSKGEKEENKNGLPTETFPSDHYYLSINFRLR